MNTINTQTTIIEQRWNLTFVDDYNTLIICPTLDGARLQDRDNPDLELLCEIGLDFIRDDYGVDFAKRWRLVSVECWLEESAQDPDLFDGDEARL